MTGRPKRSTTPLTEAGQDLSRLVNNGGLEAIHRTDTSHLLALVSPLLPVLTQHGLSHAHALRAVIEVVVADAQGLDDQLNRLARAMGEFLGLRNENLPDPPVPHHEFGTKTGTKWRRGGAHILGRGNKPIATARNARKYLDPAVNAFIEKIEELVVRGQEAADHVVKHVQGETSQVEVVQDLTAVPPKPPMAPAPNTDGASRPAKPSKRVLALVTIGAVLGITLLVILKPWQWFTYSTSSATRQAPATCTDVGNEKPGVASLNWASSFKQAYERAGGQAEIGCPRTDDDSGYVHPWGRGMSQDFRGGRAGESRIMSLNNPQRVFVMSGTYYEDYTNGQNFNGLVYGSDAAQHMGYPITELTPCGNAKMVLLDGAEPFNGGRPESPGAMATNATTHRLVWVPRDIWERYKGLNGPEGRLGLPIGAATEDRHVVIQRFEHGYIKYTNGTATTDLEDAGKQEPLTPSGIHSCLLE